MSVRDENRLLYCDSTAASSILRIVPIPQSIKYDQLSTINRIGDSDLPFHEYRSSVRPEDQDSQTLVRFRRRRVLRKRLSWHRHQ